MHANIIVLCRIDSAKPNHVQLSRNYRNHFVSAVCVVVVSVCPSHAGIVSKRLNVESQNEAKRQSPDSSFLMPNVSAKFERGHPKPRHTADADR